VSQDLIRRLFVAFDRGKRVTPRDSRYIDCDDERGTVGLRDGLSSTIRWADGPTCQLLSGQRGSGKTTELFGLREELVERNPPYFVVYCEADRYLDVNDVHYIDILLAIVQQVWGDLTAAGVPLGNSVNDLRRLLSEVIIEPDEVPEDPISEENNPFAVDIKRNVKNRYMLREYFRPRATSLLDAVNVVIREAAAELRWNAGLVVIVDNLDRMVRSVNPGTVQTNHDPLFIEASDYLRGVACHVVYTIPPALLHSFDGANLASLYGRQPYVLPMLPPITRAGTTNEQGMEKLKEIVARRAEEAGTTTATMFESEQALSRACASSGGCIGNLVALIQNSVVYAKRLPVSGRAMEQAGRDLRDGYFRSIRDPQRWELIRQVHRTKRIEQVEDAVDLLGNMLVLEYLDREGPWFDVNPFVLEASKHGHQES